jgi:VWFA-related protein
MLRQVLGPVALGAIFPLLLLGSPQDTRSQDVTITTNSELVTVPVHVTDHNGRPLHGLNKGDFVLKSDGTAERIALFEEMQTAPATAPPAKPTVSAASVTTPALVTPTKFSNLDTAAVPQQLQILAIDTVNTPLLLQGWAREQLIHYLEAKPVQQPFELVAITAGGVRRLHAFSTDTAALVASLRTLDLSVSPRDFQPPLTNLPYGLSPLAAYNQTLRAQQERQLENSANAATAGSLTLRCFEQIAGAYAGVPGRKTVFWLTSGFPMTQEVPDAPAMLGQGPANSRIASILSHHELLPEFQRAFTAMSKANVVVYPIDVAGLPLDPMTDITLPDSLFTHPEMSHLRPQPLPDQVSADRDGMQEVAHRTGGKTCTAGNTLMDCMERALAETSDYYLLGFYVSQHDRKEGWHKLKVSVSVDHGEVRARNSYFLRPVGAVSESEREEDVRSAINAPMNYTGVLFSVELQAREPRPDAPIVFKVSVPSGSVVLLPDQTKLSFDVIAVPLSKLGLPVAQQAHVVPLEMPADVAQKALVKGWNLIDTLPANVAATEVRVIVRDNYTGRIGSVLVPL